MFKQLPDNKIEICCMGLLQHICAGNYKILGMVYTFPSLVDVNTELNLNYCPCCGKKLNDEDV